MIIETRLRKMEERMEKGFAELRSLICGKNLVGNWVSQKMTCAMLTVKPRQLQNIRIHKGKDGKIAGTIRWRKGEGRSVQYHKDDIQKYLNAITVA